MKGTVKCENEKLRIILQKIVDDSATAWEKIKNQYPQPPAKGTLDWYGGAERQAIRKKMIAEFDKLKPQYRDDMKKATIDWIFED